MLDELKQLECSLHHEKRHELPWLEQRLHPECKELTRSGLLVNRAQIINALMHEQSKLAIISSDFELITAGARHAILLYRTSQPDGSRAALRSSHWVLSAEHGWQMIFHQASAAADSSQGENVGLST